MYIMLVRKRLAYTALRCSTKYKNIASTFSTTKKYINFIYIYISIWKDLKLVYGIKNDSNRKITWHQLSVYHFKTKYLLGNFWLNIIKQVNSEIPNHECHTLLLWLIILPEVFLLVAEMPTKNKSFLSLIYQ